MQFAWISVHVSLFVYSKSLNFHSVLIAQSHVTQSSFTRAEFKKTQKKKQLQCKILVATPETYWSLDCELWTEDVRFFQPFLVAVIREQQWKAKEVTVFVTLQNPSTVPCKSFPTPLMDKLGVFWWHLAFLGFI